MSGGGDTMMVLHDLGSPAQEGNRDKRKKQQGVTRTRDGQSKADLCRAENSQVTY